MANAADFSANIAGRHDPASLGLCTVLNQGGQAIRATAQELPGAPALKAVEQSSGSGLVGAVASKVALAASLSISIIEKAQKVVELVPAAAALMPVLRSAEPFIPQLRLISGAATWTNFGALLAKQELETLADVLPGAWVTPERRQTLQALAWVSETMGLMGGTMQIFAGLATLTGIAPAAATLAAAGSVFSLASLAFNPAKVVGPILGVARWTGEKAGQAWGWTSRATGAAWSATKHGATSLYGKARGLWDGYRNSAAEEELNETAADWDRDGLPSEEVLRERAELLESTAKVLGFASTVSSVVSFMSSLVVAGAAVAGVATGGTALPLVVPAAAIALKVQAISGLVSTALTAAQLYADKEAIDCRVALNRNDPAARLELRDRIKQWQFDRNKAIFMGLLGFIGDSKTLIKGHEMPDMRGTTEVAGSWKSIWPMAKNLRSGGALRLREIWGGFTGFPALKNLGKVVQFWDWFTSIMDWVARAETFLGAKDAWEKRGEIGQAALHLVHKGYVSGRDLVVSGAQKVAAFARGVWNKGTSTAKGAYNAAFGPIPRDGDITGPFFPTYGPYKESLTPEQAASAGALIFVNGMLTNLEQHTEAAQALAFATGKPVVGVFNATALPHKGSLDSKAWGVLRDLAQCTTDKIGALGLGSRNASIRSLKELIRNVGDVRRPNGGLNIYAHSQGSIIVSEALRELAVEDKRDLGDIEVTTMGNAAWTMPKGLKREHHYVFDSDSVSTTVGSSSWLGRMLPGRLLDRMGLQSTAHNTFMLHHRGAGIGPHGVHSSEQSAVTYLKSLDRFQAQERVVRQDRSNRGQSPDRISPQEHRKLTETAGDATAFAWGRFLGATGVNLVGGLYNRVDRSLPQWLRHMPIGAMMPGRGGPTWDQMNPYLRHIGDGILDSGAAYGRYRDNQYESRTVLQRSGAGDHPNVDPHLLRATLLQQSAGFAPDTNLRAQLAPHLGFDPGGARIHTGPAAAEAARSLQAEAFTIGNDVFFGAGQFDPASSSGRGLLAHEFTHVGQQAGLNNASARFYSERGGDEMEGEAQATAARVQGMDMAFVGNGPCFIVENVECLYEALESELSNEDNQRLETIAELAMGQLDALARSGGGLAGQAELSQLQVDVELDLATMTDDEAAMVWAQAVLAQARVSTRSESATTSIPGLQRSAVQDAWNRPITYMDTFSGAGTRALGSMAGLFGSVGFGASAAVAALMGHKQQARREAKTAMYMGAAGGLLGLSAAVEAVAGVGQLGVGMVSWLTGGIGNVPKWVRQQMARPRALYNDEKDRWRKFRDENNPVKQVESLQPSRLPGTGRGSKSVLNLEDEDMYSSLLESEFNSSADVAVGNRVTREVVPAAEPKSRDHNRKARIERIRDLLGGMWITDEEVSKVVGICNSVSSPEEMQQIREAALPLTESMWSERQKKRVLEALHRQPHASAAPKPPSDDGPNTLLAGLAALGLLGGAVAAGNSCPMPTNQSPWEQNSTLRTSPEVTPQPAASSSAGVRAGQLTFDAEGTEGGRFHSRRAHKPPGATSGVTIGRGYDMGHQSDVVGDMVAAGIDLGTAQKFAAAQGLKGEAAQEFLDENAADLPEITAEQQTALFEIMHDRFNMDVQRISSNYAKSKRADAKKAGEEIAEDSFEVNFTTLNPAIRDLVIDLRYRGDYTPKTRKVIQPLVIANDVEGLAEAMKDKRLWSNVPKDRFERRQAFMEKAAEEVRTQP